MGESTFLTTLSDAAFHLRRNEDQGLAGRISRAVRQELHGSAQDFQVSVTHNAILLSGECASFYTKQRIQEIARRFCEKRSLRNDIEVAVTQPR